MSIFKTPALRSARLLLTPLALTRLALLAILFITGCGDEAPLATSRAAVSIVLPTQTPIAGVTETHAKTDVDIEPSPTSTAFPSLSPTPTIDVATSTLAPFLTTNVAQLNIYAAPGLDYEVLGQVRQGDRLRLLGRIDDSSWMQVDYVGWAGWVPAHAVELDASPQSIPVVTPPPLSTVTPTSPPTPTAVLATPTAEPVPVRIAFVSDREGNWEIYTMDEQGANLRRVTYEPAQDVQPSWSPDGRRIAFVSDRDGTPEIYVMQADGSVPTRLSQGSKEACCPAWSPDGQWIAFAADRDGSYDLYLMRPDGTQVTQLTSTPDKETKPDWSPDGRRLAFVAWGDANGDGQVDDADTAGADLYLLELASGNTLRLTTSEGADTMPAWSPDGQRIAFVSDRNQVGELYLMAADGGQQTRLTSDSHYDWYPDWSPDGQWLTFESNRSGDWDVWRMQSDGTNLINLTNFPSTDRLATWTR